MTEKCRGLLESVADYVVEKKSEQDKSFAAFCGLSEHPDNGLVLGGTMMAILRLLVTGMEKDKRVRDVILSAGATYLANHIGKGVVEKLLSSGVLKGMVKGKDFSDVDKLLKDVLGKEGEE